MRLNVKIVIHQMFKQISIRHIQLQRGQRNIAFTHHYRVGTDFTILHAHFSVNHIFIGGVMLFLLKKFVKAAGAVCRKNNALDFIFRQGGNIEVQAKGRCRKFARNSFIPMTQRKGGQKNMEKSRLANPAKLTWRLRKWLEFERDIWNSLTRDVASSRREIEKRYGVA